MKISLVIGAALLISHALYAQPCTPQGNGTTYGTSNTWIGYVYDNMDFTSYLGYVNEGTPGNSNFDESFGGDYVNYPTNGCPAYTETFSVRYKLVQTFASGNYEFTVGADDGYRLSLDGGSTWVINHWNDQSYNISTATVSLNGSYNMVLEFYENGGGNRISFAVQPACIGTENQSIYGTGNTWKGYIYNDMAFGTYKGMVTEGSALNPNFDESFGGDDVMYPTSGCPAETETFSARYRLQKNFAAGTYTFTIGGDDGFRFSLDGGSTWVINNWVDQSYSIASYTTPLSGTHNLVLEYYENGGNNRVSFSISSSVLPVQLIRFGATLTGKTVLLNWLAAKETNAAYYEVEHSVDGLSFSPIATIAAGNGVSGNSTGMNYDYTDPSPVPGNNYYRLRMVDKDNSYTYSAVNRVIYQPPALVDIFPTILNKGQQVNIRSYTDLKNATVSLYEITGKEIQRFKIPVISKGQTISLTVNTATQAVKGMYLFVCRSANETVKKQLILIE